MKTHGLLSDQRLPALAWLALLWGALVLPAGAQDVFEQETTSVTKSGTTAAEFLQIGIGARATAMGEAFTATVDDVTAIYWNPSGLARIGQLTFAAEYAQWLAGIDFNFFALAVPTNFGTFGVGITAMRSPEMEVTTVAAQDGTGETFTTASYAFALSYGRALTDRFSLGGSMKVVNERIWNSSATGVAFDVGTMFVTPFRGIRLGASIANFGTKMQMTGDDLLAIIDIDPNNNGNNESNRALLRTDQFDMPLTMRIGLAGEVFQSETSRLTLAVEALNPNNSQQYVNVGAELGLLGDLVMLRGGYKELLMDADKSTETFSLGGGLRYRFSPIYFAFDYAYEAQEFLDGVNRFSLALQF